MTDSRAQHLLNPGVFQGPGAIVHLSAIFRRAFQWVKNCLVTAEPPFDRTFTTHARNTLSHLLEACLGGIRGLSQGNHVRERKIACEDCQNNNIPRKIPTLPGVLQLKGNCWPTIRQQNTHYKRRETNGLADLRK